MSAAAQLEAEQQGRAVSDLVPSPQGTVGAVAFDKQGNLAAATSTGGMTNKRPGRVGDTPIIGAGTYAKNGVCAVSCTGYGEYFIRTVAAYHIATSVEYRGLTPRAGDPRAASREDRKARWRRRHHRHRRAAAASSWISILRDVSRRAGFERRAHGGIGPL